MLTASSSSAGSVEDRKRKTSETDSLEDVSLSKKSGDASASSVSNVPDSVAIIASDIPADSVLNEVETGPEGNIVDNGQENGSNHEVLTVSEEKDDEQVQLEDSTDGTPKIAPTIIQIDFFEESSGTASLSMDFLSSRSSLYGVVEALFEYFLEDRLHEAIYSHVWIIKINKSKSFIGPFPESAFDENQVCSVTL